MASLSAIQPSQPAPTTATGGFVFVPVSGPGGAGEYYRSLAIARALVARWPDVRVCFVLSREGQQAVAADPAHFLPLPEGFAQGERRRLEPVVTGPP